MKIDDRLFESSEARQRYPSLRDFDLASSDGEIEALSGCETLEVLLIQLHVGVHPSWTGRE